MTAPLEFLRIPTRDALLGGHLPIQRALPSKAKRMIGAWCFLDQVGPIDVADTQGMQVAPHPHIGLQTFTWMIAGELMHQDSLGYQQLIQPDQINLMTAGHGISHAETSPTPHSARMHAVQLWIALPDAEFACAPSFTHYPHIPQLQQQGFTIRVLTGSLFGLHSPVEVYSPLLAADLRCTTASEIDIPLRPDFEYGLLVLTGEADVAGQPLVTGTLLYCATGQSSLRIRTSAAAHVLLIGGTPFASERVIWWNFVGRNSTDVQQAHQDWQQGHARFGQVQGFTERTPAPPLSAIKSKPTS